MEEIELLEKKISLLKELLELEEKLKQRKQEVLYVPVYVPTYPSNPQYPFNPYYPSSTPDVTPYRPIQIWY